MNVIKKHPLWIMLAAGMLLALLYLAISKSEHSRAALPDTTKVEQDGYTLEVRLNASPAAILKSNELQVRISDAAGMPVSNAKISFLLEMPHMFCGTFQGTAAQVESGLYQGNAVPLMEGDWEAKVDIEADGHQLHVVHPFAAVR